MSKLNKLLPTAMLTLAAAQSISATSVAAPATSTPLLMQFAHSGEYAEPVQLSSFAAGVVDSIELQMMPKSCDGDYECWKRVCGTGSFCGKVQVDDTDQAC